MLSVEAARAKILAALSPLPAEVVALHEAAGRVLASAVVARLTQPPADVSAMDGYALRAADAVPGAALAVIGAAPAGHPFAGTVGPGQAVRIFTGGFIPAGTDALLLQEDAEEADGHVMAREQPRAGRWVRPAGLDFSAGDTLLAPGRRLTARDIGLAAAANHPWLAVRRAARIAILATGDEIALPGEPLPPGGIVSSNAHALAAVCRAMGAVPSILPIAADTADAFAGMAETVRGHDLLVTTGGASVGAHDLVQSALAPEGFERGFWRIAMRPGKPLIWGRLGSVPLLGLPGNPVSALVCAVLFLMPALRRMGGEAATDPVFQPAIAGVDLAENDGREDYLRCALARDDAGRLVATPAAKQDSSMLRTLAGADGLLRRAVRAPALAAGAAVEVIDLGALGV
ncbi:molybdopterin molybdotransferase MoeA [Humitalea sp. 24SJ18S-53]|uniref:molybdopterin molybdotransferase MoeA n=1 Tax=Humitalea sp. 24SJ18S-53 TaxID=3422307 RepID=UPI003D67DE92